MKNYLLRITLVLAVLALMGIGCSRYVDSDNPVRSLPAPLSAPINISAKLDNGAVELNWEVLDTLKVRNFRIYITDSDGKNAHLRDTTAGVDFSRTIVGLQINQSYWFTIASVGLQGTEGDRSEPFGVTANIVSIAINGNNVYTNSRQVSVALNAPSTTTNVMLSESAAMTGAQFEPFASQKSFILSDGDGLKRIYAKFIYANGTQSGVPVTDSITLDTKARIDSVYFSPTGPFTPGSTIVFGLDAGEPDGTATVSFAGSSDISLADDGISPDLTARDGHYTGRYVVPADLSITNGHVTGSFTDGAGTKAQDVTSRQNITIANTPNAVQFSIVSALSSSSISLGWTTATGSDFSAYRLYRSLSRGVTDTSHLVSTVSDKNQTSATDTALAENSKYFYRVYVYGSSGTKAGSLIDSATTFVNQAPRPVVLAAAGADTLNIKLTWSENSDNDFAYYRLYRSTDTTDAVDTTSELITISGSQGTTSYGDIFPRGISACAYRLYVYDKQGKSAGSNKAIAKK
jgi:hypothetical protein